MSPSLQPSGRAIRHSNTIVIIISLSLSLTFCSRDRATDWGEVAAKARRRKDKTCPICIGPLERKLRGNVALLSCSHTFHEDCLCLFELFQIAEDAKPVCPLCRAEYEKKVVQCREL